MFALNLFLNDVYLAKFNVYCGCSSEVNGKKAQNSKDQRGDVNNKWHFVFVFSFRPMWFSQHCSLMHVVVSLTNCSGLLTVCAPQVTNSQQLTYLDNWWRCKWIRLGDAGIGRNHDPAARDIPDYFMYGHTNVQQCNAIVKLHWSGQNCHVKVWCVDPWFNIHGNCRGLYRPKMGQTGPDTQKTQYSTVTDGLQILLPHVYGRTSNRGNFDS